MLHMSDGYYNKGNACLKKDTVFACEVGVSGWQLVFHSERMGGGLSEIRQKVVTLVVGK